MTKGLGGRASAMRYGVQPSGCAEFEQAKA